MKSVYGSKCCDMQFELKIAFSKFDDGMADSIPNWEHLIFQGYA